MQRHVNDTANPIEHTILLIFTVAKLLVINGNIIPVFIAIKTRIKFILLFIIPLEM